jgi:hypothetical protein
LLAKRIQDTSKPAKQFVAKGGPPGESTLPVLTKSASDFLSLLLSRVVIIMPNKGLREGNNLAL